LVLPLAGLFFSARWYMKLSGHTYKVGRQTWAAIIFWYSLLAIIVGIGVMYKFVWFGVVIVVIWSLAAFACRRWLKRLRKEEQQRAVQRGAAVQQAVP
jgi:membrane protein implicated in regulation of membrane protease activity